MAGFLPMIAPLERTFRVDKDVGDVLNVADFVFAAADFEQRIVMRRSRVGRVEQQCMAETCAPAGGDLPVFTLDVVYDRRAGPAPQHGNAQAAALAAARRGQGPVQL